VSLSTSCIKNHKKKKMGEKFEVDETSNLKVESLKVAPREEPGLKEKLKVRNIT
jgi:hypothetical protein